MPSPSAPDPEALNGGRRRPQPDQPARSQRERMLEAMMRVAAEKGYEATLVADVAHAAGVSEAVFFETFGDKEGCFLESYDAMIDVLVSRVSNAFVGTVECPWPDRVGTGLRALIELLASEPEIARMAMVEVTAIGEDARERYRAALERFVPFLDEGRTYSGQGEALPADTARLAIGGATSMIFEEVRAGRGAELERILPDLIFAVLMPYLGSEAAEEEMRRVAGEQGREA